MLGLMQRVLVGDTLSPASREHLIAWLVANKTGDKRLRAGLPAGWRVGDKTGTAGGDANDVAITWPPGRAPILIASYLAEAKAPADQRNAVHAEVARSIAAAL
jgi:beta-lactamase class A